MLHFLDVAHSTLLRSVEGNSNTADDAQEAAHPANEAQPFLQYPPAQNGRNHNRKSSQGCDQNGVDEHVRCKVADFSHNHEGHPEPPPSILEVAISFARLFIVLLIRLQKTNLLDHKGYANEQSTAHGETYPYYLV